MSTKEKPTLGGTRIKARKRNIAVPLDPLSFADAVIQIYLEHGGDLELVGKDVEASDLDFSRYGDTFFEIVFTGGRNQPGTTKPEDGERQPYAVLNCEATRASILPYVLYIQKIIRRRAFLIKNLENVMRRLLQSLELFDASDRKKLAIFTALAFAQKLSALPPETIFSALSNDNLVAKGTVLSFITVQSSPPPSQASPSSSGGRTRLILAFGIAGGVTCLVVLVLSIVIIYYRLKASRTSPLEPGKHVRLRRFSYRELKLATSCFSEERKLGQGGFGTVYKGVLRSGHVVAVKKLDSASLQGEREFQNEMSVIGGLRSCHIVGLLGFCAERKRRLLVYEYMAQRSLQEALFDEEYPVSLDWKMRFRIINDIAQALDFLNSGCEPAIIHGDVKPSNVLLDDDLHAKLADFGLARPKTDLLGEVEEVGASREQRRRKSTVVVDGKDESQQMDGIQEHGGEGVEEVASIAMNAQLQLQGADGDVVEKTAGGSCDSAFSFRPPAASALPDAEACWKMGSSSEQSGGANAKHVGLELDAEDASPKPVQDADPTRQSGWAKDPEYTVDWLRCEVKGDRSKSGDCDGESPRRCFWVRQALASSRKPEVTSKKKNSRELSGGSLTKSREWWKEEYLEELSSKSKELGKGDRKQGSLSSWSLDFSGDLSSSNNNKAAVNREGWSGDLLHWLHHRSDTLDSGSRDSSRDRWSGELPTSRGMSFTTSMRGTVCYVAPEYGGGGLLSEKSDVYSFGLLVLVIVSGRRPLQVVSPSLEFERANLTTWARHLAKHGDVLDLVDSSLRGVFSTDQVRLCIMLALQCLQRLPAARPSMSEVVKTLSGEAQLSSSLADMFSPSPPQWKVPGAEG